MTETARQPHRQMTNDQDEPQKNLVLHIEVPGVYIDDLAERAAYLAEPGAPGPQHYLAVLDEWMRLDVGLTIVGKPAEGCLSSDFRVYAYNCRVVGADMRDLHGEPARVNDEAPEVRR